MSDEPPPTDILAAARERARARRERDFAEADRLKAEIEAGGWRVVDRGTAFELHPAVPPDVLVEGILRHGSSQSVPSRLGEAASEAATFVVAWGPSRGEILRTARDLRKTQPAGISVVAVLAPDADAEAAEAAGAVRTAGAARAAGPPSSSSRRGDVETVEMAGEPTPGAAANAGIRRAAGRAIVLMAAAASPTGDVATPLLRALDDPTVAIAGGRGSATDDLRHFEPVAEGDADVLEALCLAFRREDYLERGPLDERFLGAQGLAAWWSLVLRDGPGGTVSRRALVVPDLPLGPAPDAGRVAAAGKGIASDPYDGAARSDRAARRDFYRLHDRYGRRPDLTRGRRVP